MQSWQLDRRVIRSCFRDGQNNACDALSSIVVTPAWPEWRVSRISGLRSVGMRGRSPHRMTHHFQAGECGKGSRAGAPSANLAPLEAGQL